jgi:hypothetical protein
MTVEGCVQWSNEGFMTMIVTKNTRNAGRLCQNCLTNV